MAAGDVTVVGGGPHGLLHALALAQSGIDVTLLAGRRPSPTASPRATVVHWVMMGGLADLGVLNDALQQGIAHRTWSLNVLATGERMLIDLDVIADDVEHPYTLHLSQQALADIVLERLVGMSHVRVEWGTALQSLTQDDDGVTLLLDTEQGPREHRTAWVVGADGAGSRVRRAIGLGLPGTTWPERFVTTNVRHDFAAMGYEVSAVQLDQQDGAIVAQIDDNGLWRYLYAENVKLPEETVPQRMAAMFRRVLPDGEPEVEAWAAHRMHQRVADRFRVGRVALIGDAAHVTNPTSGYGLASGFFDSARLVEALTAIIQDGAAPDLLDRYSEARRRVFTDVVSPVSVDSKHLLWNADSPGRLEREVERFRVLTAKRDQLRSYLLVAPGLEGSSLRPTSRA